MKKSLRVRWIGARLSFAMACGACALFSLSVAALAAGLPASVVAQPPTGNAVERLGLRSDGSRSRGIVDCNGNGIDDTLDIENCVADPACDDCTLNGVPDGCDIAAGTVVDLNLDGVPDLCVMYDDGALDDDWGTPLNWDNDQVPNNLDLEGDESVTIGLDDVLLDLHIEVESLRMRGGSSLNVIGVVDEDFEIEEAGGILLQSDVAMRTRFLVGDGRTVSVPVGALHIRSGGLYAASGVARNGRVGLATLEVADVLIESRCGEPVPGEMALSGQMVAEVLGSMVLDATQDCVVCALCTLGNRSTLPPRGGETPPILRVTDSAVLRVGGNFMVLGSAQVIHTSSVPIEIGGNFVNHSTCPECFQFSGSMVMGGGLLVLPTTVQTIEVAGRDMGAFPRGFVDNFAVGTLEVSEGAIVSFVDTFSNSGTGKAEAIYVDTLVLQAGATVTVSDVAVYYNTLIDNGATISLVGTGTMAGVCGRNVVLFDGNCDGAVDLADLAMLQSCFSETMATPANCEAFDVEPDNDVDLVDLAAFVASFVQ